jgi:hypothetical protein
VLLHSREAGLLGQASRAPALLIEGIAFTAAGEPVEFARSFVRGDRTRYYIERIVVRSSWQTDEGDRSGSFSAASTTAATDGDRPSTTRSRRRPTAGATPG